MTNIEILSRLIDLVIHFYQRAKITLKSALPDRLFIQLQYYKRLHKWPNLDQPRTLTEKMAWRKIHQRDPRFPTFADKIAVKEPIAELIGAEHIIPTLWSGTNPAAIPFEKLEPPYIIKTNHGSGGHIFIRSAQDINRAAISQNLNRQLQQRFEPIYREWGYRDVPARILIEPMIIGGMDEVPEDYKFFVFHGRVRFLQVDIDRFKGHRQAYFDRDWNELSFEVVYPKVQHEIPRPARFDEMVALAEKVGTLVDFARIDFYHTPAGIFFSELTLYPDAGLWPVKPSQWDLTFGEEWVLPKSA